MPIVGESIAPRSPVRCSDGPAGLVERAIVSPRTGEFSHLIIERPSAPGTYWIVPAAEVVEVTADRVHLGLRRDQLNALPAQRRHQGTWLAPDPLLPPIDFAPVRSDAELAADVTRAIAADPVAGVGRVHVAVADGVVTLTGRVPAAVGRMSLKKLAESVPGVALVRLDLISDQEVAAELNRRLETEVDLRRARIRARVTAGRVSWRLRDAAPALIERARQIARATAGVEDVD